GEGAVGDEDAGLARAARGVHGGARARHLVGVRRRPARDPGRRALEPAVRPVRGAAKPAALQRLVERRLPGIELAADFLARLVDGERRALARPIDEGRRMVRRNEEADLLAVDEL